MPTTSPVTITLTNSNITTRTSSSDYTPTDSSAVVSVTWRHNGNSTSEEGAAPFNVVVEMYACSNIEYLQMAAVAVNGINMHLVLLQIQVILFYLKLIV